MVVTLELDVARARDVLRQVSPAPIEPARSPVRCSTSVSALIAGLKYPGCRSQDRVGRGRGSSRGSRRHAETEPTIRGREGRRHGWALTRTATPSPQRSAGPTSLLEFSGLDSDREVGREKHARPRAIEHEGRGRPLRRRRKERGTEPPSEIAKMAARSLSAASMTETRSSVDPPTSPALGLGPDNPVPRLSKSTRRLKDARRSRGRSHQRVLQSELHVRDEPRNERGRPVPTPRPSRQC